MHSSISVGARASPLSKAQVKEVLLEMQKTHPHISFECVFLDTIGDKDKATSLRILDKTNFFTKEIDEAQLQKKFRISIHSAKDLPEPIAKGLRVIAMTRGVDPADVLVLRKGETVDQLPSGAIVATSSERREEMVKRLRKDLKFHDLRGTIGERLAKLECGEADGVVVAEAALIRLGLTHLNRIRLEGETAENQGRLAIVAREDDLEMDLLFACLKD